MKNTWRKEISEEETKGRYAQLEMYKHETTLQTQLIDSTKRQCWQKFLEEEGHKYYSKIIVMEEDPFHMTEYRMDLLSADRL